MADFDEDYEEPFYQEVPEETRKQQSLIAKAKESPFYWRKFQIQCAILLFVSLTKNLFRLSDGSSMFLYDFGVLFTIIFCILISVLTVFEIKKQDTPCFKIALPNIMVQTNLFFNILVTIGFSYGNFDGLAMFILFMTHVFPPIFPFLIGSMFVIGCVIDKRRGN